MKFRFEDQPHQAAAVAAVTDLFEGALQAPMTVVGQAAGASGHGRFTLEPAALSANLGAVTAREAVPPEATLQLLEESDLLDAERAFPNFSVEMETGTGKTYVYISTALRLAELYGLRKFVILVHSVAIRAGVVKTFEQTAEHFAAKYPGVPYTWATLGEGPALDDFTEPGSTVRFLIVMVQAIDKPDSNAVYQEAEQASLWGTSTSGMVAIAQTRPVVIIDEPQNFATPLRRRAIATLNPLFALRYSATHREIFNLVHRLGPRQAHELGLVKRVSVKGVVGGDTGGRYLSLRKVKAVRRQLSAELLVNGPTGRERLIVRAGDDVGDQGDLEAYRGLLVDEIGRRPDRVTFTDGTTLQLGDETGIDRGALWRDQVRHTIRQHLQRQREIDDTGRQVKVLSLFFIEHVADYVGDDAVLPAMFDELYREEWRRLYHTDDGCPDPASVRTAYFASTKRGIPKDTAGRASDAELEARAYEEIIEHKERILTASNPRAFIFSHSALREGWDNPNVFQVCFLRHSHSEVERRQQIGRGLRLPVDEAGRRVMDPAVCRLTLIVDESFADFRDGLNREYVEAGIGEREAPPAPGNADAEVTVRRRPERYNSPEFAELWGRIRYRARYRVRLDGDALPAFVSGNEILDEIDYLGARANSIETAELTYDDHGRVDTADMQVSNSAGERLSIAGQQLPDLVRLVDDQLLAGKYPLQLTRRTIMQILAALPADKQRRSIHDPDRWARIVARTIRVAAIEAMVESIAYEPVDEAEWYDADVIFAPEVSTISLPLPGAKNGVEPSREGGPNLYDHVVYDSGEENNFAVVLENDTNVKFFTKLPRRFRVRTPVGDYSPDWAVVYDDTGTDRLYLIRETKDTLVLHDLEWDEAMRIRFGGKHFAAAPRGAVSYTHTTARAGLRVRDSGPESE